MTSPQARARTRTCMRVDVFPSHIARRTQPVAGFYTVSHARASMAGASAGVTCVAETPRHFQLEVLQTLGRKPHARKILWYYSERGNVGMSTLCRHLCETGAATVVDAGQPPLRIMRFIAETGRSTAYIFDIPFACRRPDRIYALMRLMKAVKDCALPRCGTHAPPGPPHVICFAHMPPPARTWVIGKWDVRRIPDVVPSL